MKRKARSEKRKVLLSVKSDQRKLLHRLCNSSLRSEELYRSAGIAPDGFVSNKDFLINDVFLLFINKFFICLCFNFKYFVSCLEKIIYGLR